MCSHDEPMECQHHANCGDFCITERERSFALCENCLDAVDHDEIHVLNDKNTIIGLQLQISGLKSALQSLLKATVDDSASEVKENALNHARNALSIAETISNYSIEQLIDEVLKNSNEVRVNREIVEQAEKYQKINTPEINDFLVAVENEALHQRERWGAENDLGKQDSDWFWLIGYLAGKIIRPNVTKEKQLHHIIASGAALLNWHASKTNSYSNMRPGTSTSLPD